MTSYLPAVGTKSVIANLKAARHEVGSGGGSGDTYLKVDDRTGEMTFGQERNLLPPDHRFVVGLHDFYHGYINMQGGQVIDRNVIPMGAGPRPVPPKTEDYPSGYGTYEGGGPRNVDEVKLCSIDEPGFNLVFTAWGSSSANRVRNLIDLAVTHEESPDGKAGFVHPVIQVRSAKYHLKAKKRPDGTSIPARDVHHFDFGLIDWLHEDGKTLLSSKGGGGSVEDAGGEPAPPWEDDILNPSAA